ncbi:MAG: hypothetical protein ACI8ZT_000183 [Bacteroidia bacterium]|jgi:hypothetical protein
MSQLAQLNIASMKYADKDPRMQDFIDALDPVNATADASAGFVWRIKSDVDSTPELEQFETSGWLVNMSVWESLEDLKRYVATPLHLSIMRRRAEWFENYHMPTMVLWWVGDGHRPDFVEAMNRLEHIRAKGPSEYAFGFSVPFDPPGRE